MDSRPCLCVEVGTPRTAGAESAALPRAARVHGARSRLGRFDAVARDLLVNHGISGSQLRERIKSIQQQQASDGPPVGVLYNACCGGFGYSELFKAYLEATAGAASTPAPSLAGSAAEAPHTAQGPLHSDREVAARLIGPFGLQLAADYPLVCQMVEAYCAHDLGAVMGRVRGLDSDGGRIRQLQRKVDAVARSIAAGGYGTRSDWQGEGGDAVERVLLHGSTSSLEAALAPLQRRGGRPEAAWSLDSLRQMEAALEAQLLHVRALRAETRASLVAALGEAHLQAMRDSLPHKFPEEAHPQQRHPSDSDGGEGLGFGDALLKHGPAHFRIWQCQQTAFDQDVMRHLLRCPHHLTELLEHSGGGSSYSAAPPGGAESARVPDHVYELGLLAAGSAGACLQVCEVPRLMEWTVTDYNGQEAVEF